VKVNVTSIVRDHLRTLYSARTNRFSLWDAVLFYGVPLGASISSYVANFTLRPDVYNVSITFFGIFIALLLNIQVAIFAILQRRWDIPSDVRLAEIQQEKLAERRTLLGELNANLSYLVLICCVALFISLLGYVAQWEKNIPPALMTFVYSHFLLTLIMVVKRAHALFQKEYTSESN